MNKVIDINKTALEAASDHFDIIMSMGTRNPDVKDLRLMKSKDRRKQPTTKKASTFFEKTYLGLE